MVSNTTNSAFQIQEKNGGDAAHAHYTLVKKIHRLKRQIQKERVESVKEKLERNGKHIKYLVSEVLLVISRNESLQSEENNVQTLSSRIDNPLCKFDSSIPQFLEEEESTNNVDVSFVKSIKLPYIRRLPPYTFWTHLSRNELMTEDESVFSRRNIFYDHYGGNTLVASDEELEELEEVKRVFSKGEDQFLRMVFEEHGLTEEVLSIVKDIIGGTSSEIQERYKNIKENDHHSEDYGESGSRTDICLNRSLSDTLDDFDYLLCRQCMIFDCSLHGCSQQFIYPSDKQSDWSEQEGDRKPCSDHCYLYHKDATISDGIRSLNLDDGNDENGASTSAALKDSIDNGQKGVMDETELKHLSNSMEGQGEEKSSVSNWKPLEKELYLKGIEMFGRNSCLISRNLLTGWKTCKEVATYMYAKESMPHEMMDENGKSDAQCNDNKMPSKPRSQRRKGKVKHSSKSAGLPSTRKRITDGKKIIRKQYTPCDCQGMCGKQCPCQLDESCCEKYCGCSKLCNNRFGGCHCTKSQCRSRHCPCFAALRECDPDVCRNCWLRCGDGSLGEPSRSGETSQCENMMLLLRKKQKILLARSSVAGWGAFLKNPANKNDFLGEYTGEVISQIEADKRGNLYDRANFSFIFDLNKEYCLDAYRKGNKLKFANHSSKPNCYARIMLVAGDHRVGIYAKERIEAGEELFYDYGPEYTSPWIHKLSGDASEKNDPTYSQEKAKKL